MVVRSFVKSLAFAGPLAFERPLVLRSRFSISIR